MKVILTAAGILWNKERDDPVPLKKQPQSGNVLIIILVAIAAIAMLTYAVTQSSEQQSDTITRQTIDDGVSRLLTQAATLEGAVQQLVMNGEDASALYSTLSVLKPGDAGFATSPHNLKIYHPLGGGITYMPGSVSGSETVATDAGINRSSIVTGVGATDAVIGDILFTAKVSTAAYCGRINQILTGSATVPVLATFDFDALFTAGTPVTITAINCANCVNIPKLCVSNTTADAWGFYASLLPG